MKYETLKTKQTRQAKNISIKKETVAPIFIVHKKKGRRDMFHLRAKIGRKWVSCGTFYSEVGWWSWSILPRGEREGPVLQLQYQFGGQSIHFRTETRGSESCRTLQNKTANKQVVRVGLPVKNRILYTIK